MTSAGRFRGHIVARLAAAVGLIALPATAQEATSPEAPPPPPLVRAYVPAGSPELWPRSAEPMIPVPAAEFESLWRGSVGNRAARLAPRAIDSAEFVAELADNDLLRGTAALYVTRWHDEVDWLPLAPCGIAIHRATFRSTQPATGDDVPSVLPAIISTSSQGVALVEAPGAGVVTLEWSLRGKRDAAGRTAWPLEFPWAAAQTLQLRLPPGLEAHVDGASVVGRPDESNESAWSFALPPSGGSVLRVGRHAEDSSALTPFRGKVRLTYDVGLDRLEVEARLLLDNAAATTKSLVFFTSPELEIDQCRAGGAELAPREAGEEDRRRRWEAPLGDLGASENEPVIIRGHASVTLDHAWRLPTIAVDDRQWVDGTQTLRVERPLLVERLEINDGRLSRAALLSGASSGEVYEAQCFGPRTQIEATFSTRRTPYRVKWACQAQASRRSLTAVVTANIEATIGGITAWQTELGPNWNVVGVVDRRTDQAVDWHVQRQTGPSPRLVVAPFIGDAAAANRQWRIELERELGDDMAPLSALDVWPLRAPHDQVEASWLNVQTPAPVGWTVAGPAQALAVDPASFDLSEMGDVGPDRDGWWFDVGQPLPGSLLIPMHGQFQFSARASSHLRLSADRREESHRLLLVPQGGAIERVVVQLPADGAAWQAAAGDGPSFAVTAAPMPDDRPTGRYELRLSPPQSAACQIVLRRTCSAEASFDFALPRLADGGGQGECVVVADADALVELHPRGLERRLPNVETDENPLAAYDYDLSSPKPARLGVVVQSGAVASEAGPVVWRMHVDSRIGPGDDARHRARLYLTAKPNAALPVRLSPTARLVAATIDREPVAWHEDAGTYEFLLPDRGQCQLELEYVVPGRGWSHFRHLSNPAPKLATAALVTRWTAWLPPNFWLLGHASRSHEGGWPARLLGPLARASSVPAWRPPTRQISNWGDWFNPSGARALELAEHAEAAIGAAVRGRDDSSRTWGEVFRLAGETLADARRDLRLDAAALTDLGLTSSHTCGKATGATDIERGRQALYRAHLALVIQGSRVMVTSAAEAFRPGDAVNRLTDVTALAQDDRALSETGGSRSITPRQWAVPIPPAWMDHADVADVAGWSAWRLDGGGEGRLVVSQQLLWGLGIAIGLMSAAVTWRLGRRRRSHAVAWGAACGALALTVPGHCAAPLTAAVWGWVAAGAVSWAVWRSAAPAGTSFPRRAALLAAVCALLSEGGLQPSATCGQEAPRPLGPPVRVLIPVDDDRRPTGQPYQIPASLYRNLRRSAQTTVAPFRPTFNDIHYHAQLERNALTGKLDLTRLTAHLDGHSTGEPLVLPLRWLGRPPIQRIAIDGVEQSVAWDDAAGALRAAAPPPGRFHLEAVLVSPDAPDSTGRCELLTPASAAAVLEVALPDASAVVEAPTARGEVAWSADGRRFVAHLGSSQRLAWQWHSAGIASRPRVEQLWWLQAQPGSVMWRLRLRCDSADAPLERLELRCDPRLEWLPAQSPDAADAAIKAVDDLPHALEVRWDNPRPGTRQAELAWLVRDAVGIGQTPLPTLEIPGVETTRVWLAASVDASLDFSAVVAEELPTANFLERWGPADDPPGLLMARQLDPAQPRWEVNLQPKPPDLLAAEEVEWLIAPGATADMAAPSDATASLSYTATCQVERGAQFCYELDLPPDMTLRRVVVLEKETQQARRWRLDDAGRLTIWLSAPATQPQTIRVEGQLPATAASTLSLAAPVLHQAKVQSHQTRVYRAPGVTVDLEPAADAPPQDDLPAPLMARSAQSVAAWSARPASPVRIRIGLAPTDLDVEQTTLVRFDGEYWRLESTLQWSSAPGPASPLCVQVPAGLQADLELSPVMAHRWLTQSEAAQTAQLVLLPNTERGAQARCTLRCRLGALAGGFSLPMFSPTAASVRHIVLLPREVELQPASWQTKGLEPVEPLTAEAAAGWSAQTHRALRVTADRYAAELAALPADAPGPRIELAQVELAPQGDGWAGWSGLATFDLVAGDAGQMPLSVPAGVRLASVMVEGAPVREILPVQKRLCRVPLLAGRLPQRVEIAFTVAVRDPAAMDIASLVPAPVNLPVKQSLLHVWRPAETTIVRGDPSLSVLQRARLLLDAEAELLQLAVSTASAAELRSWFGRRQSVLANHLALAQGLAGRTAPSTDASGVAAGMLMAQIEALRRQLKEAELDELTNRGTRTGASARAGELWRFAVNPHWIGHSWRFDGTLPQGRVAFQLNPAAERMDRFPWRRWAAALVLCCGAWWGYRSPMVAGLLNRPYFLGVLVGLSAWVWLQPPWLGPTMVVVAVIAWLARVRPTRRPAPWPIAAWSRRTGV